MMSMKSSNRIFVFDEYIAEERRKYLVVVIYDMKIAVGLHLLNICRALEFGCKNQHLNVFYQILNMKN